MEFKRLNFQGDPNIGLYSYATDKYCLLGYSVEVKNKIKKLLNVDIKISTIAGTKFIGIFVAGNDNGIVLPKIVEKEELQKFKKIFPKVTVIDSKETALGNLILCNNHGCIISKTLLKFKKQIQEALGVPVITGEIAGFSIVGSVARATDKGCLCHRETTEKELKIIEKHLKVKADIGTVNYGTPYIKAGVIVNTKGIITSEQTTGPELDRVFEVFS